MHRCNASGAKGGVLAKLRRPRLKQGRVRWDRVARQPAPCKPRRACCSRWPCAAPIALVVATLALPYTSNRNLS
eukprot:1010264-Pleurochrysis_carterae.AAC.3